MELRPRLGGRRLAAPSTKHGLFNLAGAGLPATGSRSTGQAGAFRITGPEARWPPLKRLAHRCAVRRRPLPTQRGGRWKLRTPDPSAPGHPSSLPVIPTLLWRLPPDPSPLRPSLVPSGARRLDFLSPCAGARGHGGGDFRARVGPDLDADLQSQAMCECKFAPSHPTARRVATRAHRANAVLRRPAEAEGLRCARAGRCLSGRG